MKRIPVNAYELYVALGEQRRSYAALAAQLGVSKRCVTIRARREHWQERLHAMEARVCEEASRRLEEDAVAMRERHLRTVRAVQVRALEVLRTKPIQSAADASRVLLAAQREERALVGSASGGRVEVSVERGVRERFERRTVAVRQGGAAEDVAGVVAEDVEPQ